MSDEDGIAHYARLTRDASEHAARQRSRESARHEDQREIERLRAENAEFLSAAEEWARLHKEVSAENAKLREALAAWKNAAEYSRKYGHLEDARESITGAWEYAEGLREATLPPPLSESEP